MGIDPGTTRTGYGILEVSGNKLYAIALGDIDMRREHDVYRKLRIIFQRTSELIEQYRPDEVALESPFFGENVQSMLKLGRAQGVAMAAALDRGIEVFEYAPRRVKQAITGRGAAAKEQVAALLAGMLGIEYDPRRLDATDGMAVALCHHFTTSSPILRKLRNSRSTSSGRPTVPDDSISHARSTSSGRPTVPADSISRARSTSDSTLASVSAGRPTTYPAGQNPLSRKPAVPTGNPAATSVQADKSGSRSDSRSPKAGSRKPASWEDFTRKNPDRIKD